MKNLVSVKFEGGESRTHGGKCCNFMTVDYDELRKHFTDDELEEMFDVSYPDSVEDVELYAEWVCGVDFETDDDEIGDEGYEELKAEIIRQAKAHGIDENNLKFLYD